MNTRRHFLKQAGSASAALSTFGTPLLGREAARPATPKKTLRLGFVGVGVKGSAHVGQLMRMEGVELRAVCDIVDLQCREVQEQAKRLGLRPPTICSRGPRDFRAHVRGGGVGPRLHRQTLGAACTRLPLRNAKRQARRV